MRRGARMRSSMEQPPSRDPQPRGESYRRGRRTPSAWIGLGSLLAVAGWTFLRHRPARVTIEGPSMAPTLFPGDWVIVVPQRVYRRRAVVVGEQSLAADEFWVEGDGPASTDSRHFGPVTRAELKARAIFVYRPRERRGLIR